MVRDCSLIQFVDYIYFFFMYWGGGRYFRLSLWHSRSMILFCRLLSFVCSCVFKSLKISCCFFICSTVAS